MKIQNRFVCTQCTGFANEFMCIKVYRYTQSVVTLILKRFGEVWAQFHDSAQYRKILQLSGPKNQGKYTYRASAELYGEQNQQIGP